MDLLQWEKLSCRMLARETSLLLSFNKYSPGVLASNVNLPVGCVEDVEAGDEALRFSRWILNRFLNRSRRESLESFVDIVSRPERRADVTAVAVFVKREDGVSPSARISLGTKAKCRSWLA